MERDSLIHHSNINKMIFTNNLITLTLLALCSLPICAQPSVRQDNVEVRVAAKTFNAAKSFLGTKINADDTWTDVGNTFTHNPNFKSHAQRNVLWFPDYRLQPFQSSAKAKAADPQADSKKIDRGFTQHYSHIHAFYEHLSKWYYPYQPYYHDRDFYWMHNDDDNKRMLTEFNHFAKQVVASTGRRPAKFAYHAVTLPDGTRAHVPYDERFRTAWTALYLSNPTSIKAFQYYAMTLLSTDPILAHCFENVAPAAKGGKYTTPHREQFEKMRTNRDKMTLIMAANYLKYEDLCQFIQRNFQRFETAETAYGKLLAGWVGHVTYQNVFKNHRNHKEDSAEVQTFNRLDAAFLKGYPALRDQLAKETGLWSAPVADTKCSATEKKRPVGKRGKGRRR